MTLVEWDERVRQNVAYQGASFLKNPTLCKVLHLGFFTFSALRGWSAADSLYFSFAALATIGIFDGPNAAAPEAAPLSSSVGADESAVGGGGREALFVTACTLYLLFGLALVAMCFNLIVMDRAYARWQRMQGAYFEWVQGIAYNQRYRG